ncbi:MAG TPA: HAMP domain-containing sensor histidine kinase [Candidatus Binatia bacterium]|nr:HAMP domain-containing sensor histidine kinase [Candidatus Binatia bacterium]
MAEKPPPAAADSDDFFRALDTQLLVHELKGPLVLIEAAARTLIEQTGRMGPLTERQEKTVKRILRGTLRGRRLVNQLLEIGRAESAQFSLASFDVGEAVLTVLIESVESSDAQLTARLSEVTAGEAQAVLAQAGITIKIAPEIDQLRIFQDSAKFGLIVANLIQNALHFRRRSLEIILDREGGDLIISVQDDGPGIPPEHHAAVFERYKQLPIHDGFERKGHGLGLAGALILARRLGGDISLDSVPGQGATFRFRIPEQGKTQSL